MLSSTHVHTLSLLHSTSLECFFMLMYIFIFSTHFCSCYCNYYYYYDWCCMYAVMYYSCVNKFVCLYAYVAGGVFGDGGSWRLNPSTFLKFCEIYMEFDVCMQCMLEYVGVCGRYEYKCVGGVRQWSLWDE